MINDNILIHIAHCIYSVMRIKPQEYRAALRQEAVTFCPGPSMQSRHGTFNGPVSCNSICRRASTKPRFVDPRVVGKCWECWKICDGKEMQSIAKPESQLFSYCLLQCRRHVLYWIVLHWNHLESSRVTTKFMQTVKIHHVIYFLILFAHNLKQASRAWSVWDPGPCRFPCPRTGPHTSRELAMHIVCTLYAGQTKKTRQASNSSQMWSGLDQVNRSKYFCAAGTSGSISKVPTSIHTDWTWFCFMPYLYLPVHGA